MDSWYNAYDARLIRAESQFIPHTTIPLLTYHGLKSTNNTVQYFYSLTQQTVILVHVVLDGLGVMLTKCSPTWILAKSTRSCCQICVSCSNNWMYLMKGLLYKLLHNGALYWYSLQTCFGIMTSTDLDTGQQNLNAGHVCIIFSSLTLIKAITVVHDLWSSFELMKNLSDLRITNARICCIKNFWHHTVIVSMSVQSSRIIQEIFRSFH